MSAPASGRRSGGEPIGEPPPCDSAFVSAAEPAEQAKRKLDAARGPTHPLKSLVGKLSEAVAEDLRRRLEEGEWNPSERLPGEHELAATYGVSRATIRTALRAVDSRGLTVTLHGLGTFATAATRAVPADLQRLESISATIVRLERRPGTTFRTISIREGTPRETAALDIAVGAPVLSTQREITADDEIVAYSHDTIPRDVLATDFDVRMVSGSLFNLLDRHDVHVTSALTGIHASTGHEIGWGDQPRGTLYVLLEQTHFDARSRAVAYSRTWFIEGRFQFNLVRVR